MSFDALTHLDFPEIDSHRSAIIKRACAVGVTGWAIAGTEPKHWERVLRIAHQTGGTPLLGIHPWWASDLSERELEAALAELQCGPKHGIGEIGLDYGRAKTQEARDRQKTVFRKQLAIARALNRPVALHCVRAHSDMLHILKKEGLPPAGGMMHGWSGGTQFVEPAIHLGLLLSFGPSVLNPNRKKVRESLPAVPLDRLCIETDSPDNPLAGQSYGQPADLLSVSQAVANLRTETHELIWERCGMNARSLWRATS